MLYLALSCLQGREMLAAAEELLSLNAGGLQLTPGNVPTKNFGEWLHKNQIPIRIHHGFHWEKFKCKVWNEAADCLVNADSVHPPQIQDSIAENWKQKAEQGAYAQIVLETMYPKYCLGSGKEISWAMDIGLQLAVDVSHIHIQLCQGSMEISIWQKLQNYENIREIHISANEGRADTHQPLTEKSLGIGWVRERNQDGMPIVLECYMHRLSETQRREQVDLLVG